ncbi:hypothetical protein HYT84_00520 [Candidatus Micrarchaeota archaeon]|nr:hypothetical protein [Candidatus Micrarchaeota archaeon]
MDYSGFGKILLLGGYSVLERPNTSLVLAVSAKVSTSIKELKTDKIIIKIPQFKIKLKGSMEDFEKKKIEGKEKFVLAAIKTSLDYLKFKKIRLNGFTITTKSDKEFSVNSGKSGLGSSAAVTVAMVKAVLGLHGITDLNEVHKLAQFAHSLAQGKVGSGFDVATAVYGTIIYSRYSLELIDLKNQIKFFKNDLDCKIEKFKLPNFELIFANIPNSSMETVSAVSRYFEFRRDKPASISIIQDLNNANRKAIEALEEENLNAFKYYFEYGRRLTKEFGKIAGIEIEPDDLSELIAESYSNGAFVCKLPGAGGRDAIVALCRSKGTASKLKRFWKSKGLNVLNVKLV